MGSMGSSDFEERRGNPCISKRLKIPKKLSDGFIPVDYALVPRKVRSAKKRSSGSVSPQLLICKKHNHVANEDKLSGKNGMKKLKSNMEQEISVRPGRHIFGSTITKDEEEVAETLYALADMFPETAKDKTKLTGEPSKLESEAFSNMEMSRSGAKAVLEKETESRTIVIAGTSEVVKIRSSSDGSWLESASIPQQLNLEIGKIPASAALNGGQHELPHSLRENKSDGLSLWLGLPLKKSLHSEMQSHILQSSTSKFSTISQMQNLENLVSTKNSHASKKPWKKCCTHVHICNLTNELKKADTLQMQCTQPAHIEELGRGAFITSNTPTENANCVFPSISTSKAVSSAADTSSDEIRNAVLLHNRLLQDQQHPVSASHFFTLQNHKLDFFPLPAGAARGESSNGSSKVDHRAGTVAQFHFPYLHSKNQHTIPFLLPQNYCSTNSSTSGGTTVDQQQVRLASYHGGRNHAPETGVPELSKQQPWHPQQQNNWYDQLRENWKAGRIASSNIANRQSEVQDGQYQLQFAPFFSPSNSSLAVHGQHYATRQQNQPRLSLPPSMEQGQPHLHYGSQGRGGRHPDTVQPALQSAVLET